MGRSCMLIRPGAAGVAMLAHRKPGAAPPVSMQERPTARVSRPLGASGTLDDASASPTHTLLPRRWDTRSHGYFLSDLHH